MTAEIQDYPNSSCDCYECNIYMPNSPDEKPSNSGVRGCNQNCFRTTVFKDQVEPNTESGITYINPSVFSGNKLDKTFNGLNDSSGYITYSDNDPRLVNAAAGQRIRLDKPPLNSSTKLYSLITDKKLDRYGQNYKSYDDINAGQIVYYIDKSKQDAYFEPLFSIKSRTVGTMYTDPMGNIKPVYTRTPLPDPTNKYNNCLTDIRDSQYHREDILSKQMRVINQTRWEPRWTNNH
jgi:hypothetical protein